MKRLIAACMTLLTAAALLMSTEPAHADRVDCTGYPESRQFVDAQAWWKRTPDASGTDYGHVHIGGCIPEREQQSDTISLDVRILLHDNPGKISKAVLVTQSPYTETTRIYDTSMKGMTCLVGSCEVWVKWLVPLSWFDYSGLQEIRYRVYVDEPNGNRMIASLNYQTYINTAMPRKSVTRNAYLRAKGWYSGAGYCEASLRQSLPDQDMTTNYAPVVASVDHATAGDLPVTHAIVLRDANFHESIPGTTIAEYFDAFGPQSVPAGLGAEPGSHKLIIKSDCDDPRGSTNSGVLVFPFKTN